MDIMHKRFQNILLRSRAKGRLKKSSFVSARSKKMSGQPMEAVLSPGAHVASVDTEAEQCDNCREPAELVVEGFLPAIAKLSGLSSFDSSAVIPYPGKSRRNAPLSLVWVFRNSLTHFT